MKRKCAHNAICPALSSAHLVEHAPYVSFVNGIYPLCSHESVRGSHGDTSKRKQRHSMVEAP